MARITRVQLHRTVYDILRQGDLNSLTPKKIRMICQRVYNADLSDRINEIGEIVNEFVVEKSKEEDEAEENANAENVHNENANNVEISNAEDTNNQSNTESHDESGSGSEEEEEEEESGSGSGSGSDSGSGSGSGSGSESSSNSEHSDSSDNEANHKKDSHHTPEKTSRQPRSHTSGLQLPPKKAPVKNVGKVAPTNYEVVEPVQSTSKMPVAAIVQPERPVRTIIAPPKKRKSMNTIADDVAAVTAVELPPKKKKILDDNNKSDAALPSKKVNPVASNRNEDSDTNEASVINFCTSDCLANIYKKKVAMLKKKVDSNTTRITTRNTRITTRNAARNAVADGVNVGASTSRGENNDAARNASARSCANANDDEEIDDVTLARRLQAEEFGFRPDTIKKLGWF